MDRLRPTGPTSIRRASSAALRPGQGGIPVLLRRIPRPSHTESRGVEETIKPGRLSTDGEHAETGFLFFSVGKNSPVEGCLRYYGQNPKLFWPGACLQGSPARRSRIAPERPSLPPRRRPAASCFGAIFVQFSRRFSTVAAVAETFQVVPVTELRPVALVVDDVVDVRCTDTLALLRTFTAERLPQELRRPQVELPLVCAVHPVPGLCLRASPVAARPVGVAVAIAHQHAAAGVSAGSERLSPPAKQKATANTPEIGVVSSGY